MTQALVSRSDLSDIQTLAPGLAGLRTIMVNLYFAGRRGEPWFLVDTGLPGSASTIRQAAEERFGPRARPEAIILTHGHFDHVGGVQQLSEEWDVPVYAHELELPYLDGRSSYPPPDPNVGGGLMALMSPMYPRGPIELGGRLRTLPEDGTIPGFPDWRWIATPGHSPGHVSLFRHSDRALIAGDAFVTTQQASLSAVITQRVEMHGPPAYFTCDWDAARESVRALAKLRPTILATGHGLPLAGHSALETLEELARNFDRLERPRHGRYSERPAIAGREGVRSVPPPVLSPELRNMLMITAGVLVLSGALLWRRRRA